MAQPGDRPASRSQREGDREPHRAPVRQAWPQCPAAPGHRPPGHGGHAARGAGVGTPRAPQRTIGRTAGGSVGQVTAAGSAAADLIVVGSGVAALTAALEAQSCGLEVIVVTKAEASECSTRFAQGGVAVALPGDADDSVERHVADTLTAGAGLSDDLAASAILTDGPEAVTALLESGANFDTTPQGRLARTAEGGHSAQRVIHAGGDATGAEIERTLLAAARDRRLPILERHCAVQVLLTEAGEVAGLLVIDVDN